MTNLGFVSGFREPSKILLVRNSVCLTEGLISDLSKNDPIPFFFF